MKTLIVVLLFVVACASADEKRLLEESQRVHLQGLQTGREVEKELEKLRAFLEESDSTFLLSYEDSLESYESAFHQWLDDNLEVPGFEDEHDHSDHGHSHHSSIQVTPEMMLEIQIELKSQIDQLKTSIEKTNSTFTKKYR